MNLSRISFFNNLAQRAKDTRTKTKQTLTSLLVAGLVTLPSCHSQQGSANAETHVVRVGIDSLEDALGEAVDGDKIKLTKGSSPIMGGYHTITNDLLIHGHSYSIKGCLTIKDSDVTLQDLGLTEDLHNPGKCNVEVLGDSSLNVSSGSMTRARESIIFDSTGDLNVTNVIFANGVLNSNTLRILRNDGTINIVKSHIGGSGNGIEVSPTNGSTGNINIMNNNFEYHTNNAIVFSRPHLGSSRILNNAIDLSTVGIGGISNITSPEIRRNNFFQTGTSLGGDSKQSTQKSIEENYTQDPNRYEEDAIAVPPSSFLNHRGERNDNTGYFPAHRTYISSYDPGDLPQETLENSEVEGITNRFTVELPQWEVSYTLQRSEDLESWTNLQTEVCPYLGGNPIVLEDTTELNKAYYRIKTH